MKLAVWQQTFRRRKERSLAVHLSLPVGLPGV